ncbi:nuclear pore complex protein NUP85 [Impatiens glandulifera]|uniref:nuclear pore complex protein NUP85 n=1 Tax=Impatiens glandulifera TaxID=253017 RepID=UPI001FB0B10A|nr:nuclear pore complex protein NUP85 [Impatiens glandulifera]
MPGVPSSNHGDSLVLAPFSMELEPPAVLSIHHAVKPPISLLSISWCRGNTLRVSVFGNSQTEKNVQQDGEVAGEVVEVKLSGVGNGEIDGAQWRRIAYGSVSPFALLQSRKNSLASLSKMESISPSNLDWQEYVAEYSNEILSLLGGPKLQSDSIFEDQMAVMKKDEEPTSLKAAWMLMHIFYADKQSETWISEQLVDWLTEYDCLLSATQSTVHSKLVNFQSEIVSLQAIENDPKYWEAISSALAVGWLDVVVKLLRLHGSYQLDQLAKRETENGLVEAVAVLISNMPRMRPEPESAKLGQFFMTKPDFVKGWDKWRAQITKLDCSAFWIRCDHRQTREGLKNILQIMLGNTSSLSNATYHWIELYISHLLYIRPFTLGLESMYNLAQKCLQLKPMSYSHMLMILLISILGENTEVVLAECSKSFGPWMVVHAIELLSAGSTPAEVLLKEEYDNLGGISMEELHRVVYALVLSSHSLTWQIAPIYLISCMKQGIGLLETLLYKQSVQQNQLLKTMEICRLYELGNMSSTVMRIAGVHNWKHGKKGSGVFWLQQARDEVRLNRISQQLFDFVGKSISDEGFKQWEGLIELLGSESKTAGGLEFLRQYRDLKRSLQHVRDTVSVESAQKAIASLVSLMKNPSTPQRFWLPLLYDSLNLINWQERPLLNTSQTNLLLNKLQELSMSRLRPDFVEADVPREALSSIRLALATNLGRVILEE